MPHLGDDRLALVRRLYETSELTIAEIAVLADVSESAIYQRARREEWANWRRPGVTPRRAKPRPPLAPTPALLALGHGRDTDGRHHANAHGRGHGRDDDFRDPGRIGDRETGAGEAASLDRPPLDRPALDGASPDRAATARRLWLAVDRHLADLETYGGPEGMIRAAQNLATLARTLETLVDVERELAPQPRPHGRPAGGPYGEPDLAHGGDMEEHRRRLAEKLEGLLKERLERFAAEEAAAEAEETWAMAPAARAIGAEAG